MFGADVRYDHRVGLWLKDKDEDSDVWPAHTLCDKPKTAADQARIAKTKRQHAKHHGLVKPKGTIKGSGFNKKLTKGLDGKVRSRKPRRTRAR